MTRDDLIRMALKACEVDEDPFVSGWITMDYEEIERFAALVAAAEREACAKVCERHADPSAGIIAAAIRARGQA